MGLRSQRGEQDIAALREVVVDQLQAIHALKAASLRMFDPMLAAVRKERDNPDMAIVVDLLERMLSAFGEHREQTVEHERRLEARLRALGEGSAGPLRRMGANAAASMRASLGGLGGQNHGANARDAFVFEHVEIATLELLERLARLAGDHETARVARECRADDVAMATKITNNWDNVLSLMLASKRIRFERPGEQADSPPANGASAAAEPEVGAR